MSTIVNTLNEVHLAKGEIRAAGTDLMDRVRHGISPREIVDISRLPAMDQIYILPGGGLKIGALVTIEQVAQHDYLRTHYPGLAAAASALATPQIRRAATMGGALLQRSRCWYYRHEGFSCYKKGGNSCPAREGNHQYGVCFDLGPCVAPHPSTLGMALLAYDAKVEIYGRGFMTVKDLYGDGSDPSRDHVLVPGQTLTYIMLQPVPENEMAAYFRSISRAQAEWPLVEVLVRGYWRDNAIADCRVVVGGVANIPMELLEIGKFLNGKTPDEALFQKAADMATQGVKPLRDTAYKVSQLRGAVYHTLFDAFTESPLPNLLIED